jgi:hypothetical protein
MGARREYSENWQLIQAIDERSRELVVQELLKSYFYYRMLSANNIINVHDTLEVPMYIAPPAAGKWIDKGDMLPDFQTTAAAMGYWTNRYAVFPTGYDVLEMMQKEGDPNQIFDLSELRASEHAWAIRRTLASAVFNGAGGKAPDGLSTIIEKAAPGSQAAVVGGIDKATKAWFRNKYVQLTSNFGAIAASTTLFAGFLAALQLKDQCTIGTLVPSDMITTRDIFLMFRRGMLEMSTPYHLVTERKVAEFGHKNFMFDGSYLAWDPNCPADSIYCLHLEDKFEAERTGDPRDTARLDKDLEDIGVKSPLSLKGNLGLIMHPKIKMRKIAPRTPYRQLAETSWTITSLNLGCNRLSDNGVAGSDNGSRWSTWA